MNLRETDLKDNSEAVSVNLDGLRLVQMHQDYLRDFKDLKDFKAFEHQIDSERRIKSNEITFSFQSQSNRFRQNDLMAKTSPIQWKAGGRQRYLN